MVTLRKGHGKGRSIEVFKIATTKPGHVVSVSVRYPSHRPRGFILEVATYEERDGVSIHAFSSASREAALVPATRFNARKLDELAAAVRTLGTEERFIAEREYRAYMAEQGLMAPMSPFGDA